jgi:hypothetical protein
MDATSRDVIDPLPVKIVKRGGTVQKPKGRRWQDNVAYDWEKDTRDRCKRGPFTGSGTHHTLGDTLAAIAEYTASRDAFDRSMNLGPKLGRHARKGVKRV